jgi:4-coumarate--CoA ligase
MFGDPHKDLSEKKAWIDANHPDDYYFTRNQLRLWAQRVAVGLLRSPHFKNGDRILIFSPNTMATPVAFMGILMAGGIFTGANPTFVPRELANQLKDSQATYLFCADESLDTGIEAAKQAGLDESRIYVFNSNVCFGDKASQVGLKGCKYWGELVASPEESKDYQWEELRVC